MAWVIAGILAVLTIALFLKQMRDSALVNELREARDDAQKDTRRVAEKLKAFDQKMSKKDQELGASKESKKQLQDAEAAKRSAEAAKKAADEERAKVEARNRELSADLSRVRIEKEQQRQELMAARDRLRDLGASAEQITELKAAAARADGQAREAEKRNEALKSEVAAARPVAGESEEQREERLSTRLKKEVERLNTSVQKLEGALEKWKQQAIESESNLRRNDKRLRDSQSLLNITQSQLDHALDEIHVLKFGDEPEHPLIDKAKKRAALKPKEAGVELRPGEVVVLPDLDKKNDLAKPAVDDAPGAPEAKPAETKAPEAKKPEAKPAETKKPEPPKAEPKDSAPKKPEPKAPAAKKPDDTVPETKKAEPRKAKEPEGKEAEGKAPVLRRKEPEAAPSKTEEKATRPKAPPRPKK